MGGLAPGSGVPLTGGNGGEIPSVGRNARIASMPVSAGAAIGGGGVAGNSTFCCGATVALAVFGEFAALLLGEVCGAAIASSVDFGVGEAAGLLLLAVGEVL